MAEIFPRLFLEFSLRFRPRGPLGVKYSRSPREELQNNSGIPEGKTQSKTMFLITSYEKLEIHIKIRLDFGLEYNEHRFS